jgi:hypothetical protein
MPGGAPLLTGLLLAYFAAYVLAAGVRLASVPSVAQAGAGVAGSGVAGSGVAGSGVAGELPRPSAITAVGRELGAPEMAAACRVSMAIGMLAMLLTL